MKRQKQWVSPLTEHCINIISHLQQPPLSCAPFRAHLHIQPLRSLAIIFPRTQHFLPRHWGFSILLPPSSSPSLRKLEHLWLNLISRSLDGRASHCFLSVCLPAQHTGLIYSFPSPYSLPWRRGGRKNGEGKAVERKQRWNGKDVEESEGKRRKQGREGRKNGMKGKGVKAGRRKKSERRRDAWRGKGGKSHGKRRKECRGGRENGM